jgi:hypothetical protein
MKHALSERRGVALPEAPRVEKVRTKYTREQYVEGIISGDRGMLARAITLIESAREADRELAGLILEDCLPHSGNSLRVGITGVPGGGKSSLIEALGRCLVEERQQKVAVLAVDPTSQISRVRSSGPRPRAEQRAALRIARARRCCCARRRATKTCWLRPSAWGKLRLRCAGWWTSSSW